MRSRPLNGRLPGEHRQQGTVRTFSRPHPYRTIYAGPGGFSFFQIPRATPRHSAAVAYLHPAMKARQPDGGNAGDDHAIVGTAQGRGVEFERRSCAGDGRARGDLGRRLVESPKRSKYRVGQGPSPGTRVKLVHESPMVGETCRYFMIAASTLKEPHHSINHSRAGRLWRDANTGLPQGAARYPLPCCSFVKTAPLLLSRYPIP